MSALLRVLPSLAVLCLLNSTARAVVGLQSPAGCSPTWLPTFGGAPGTDEAVRALVVFNDGSGPALFVAGGFETAGGVATEGVAKWNGSSWSAMGNGANTYVAALAIFDDGGGPALYGAGGFTQGGVPTAGVAKWNGSSWSVLGSGMNDDVLALAVFDDGSGPALYAGGYFTTAGGVSANRLAKWNGAIWSALGSGMGNYHVDALTVFDDGSGPALFAGGDFTTAGGIPANRIAKWNGSSWAALGIGVSSYVTALAVFDDGSGPALFAGGLFTTAGGIGADHIAKWDGSSWFPLDGGTNDWVRALTVFDDGSGPALYAGGDLTTAGGVAANRIARWNGSSWSALGSGIDSPLAQVFALTPFDDGNGPALFVGASCRTAGGVAANHIARWNGSSWAALGSGINRDVRALTAFDDGSGPALYAGGAFTTTGDVVANRVAKWSGSSWSTLGSGTDGDVRVLAMFDDGSGPALYAGGEFATAGGVTANHIARWNGSSWSALGSGMNLPTSGYVEALTVFDDGGGPALYAGGNFTTAGGVTVNRIAKWNGSSWSALGIGANGIVLALAVFDDGSGPALYAGGTFTSAGGVAANRIAKWNGSSWSALGSGVGLVSALTVFDDGSGPALFAGGAVVNKWNGSSWTALGDMENHVFALTVFDDGNGSALYAGGPFTTAGGVSANHVAKWDGSSWSALGSGLSGSTDSQQSGVTALTVFDDGGGPTLYVGSAFASAVDSGDSYLARWGCTLPSPGTAFCFGDGTAGMIACPCNNTGAPGHGCANSQLPGRGARLASSGSPSADTVRLTSSEERPQALSIFLQGNVNIATGLVYGDGIRCAGGTLKRLYTKNASSGMVAAPGAGELSIRARSAAAGDTIPGGATRYYQVYYRDPNPTFCPSPQGNTWNVSNGIEIVWP